MVVNYFTRSLQKLGIFVIASIAISQILNFKSASAGTFIKEKSQNKTLVIVDTWATLETHSIFFDHIQKMGSGNHTLEFKVVSGNPSDPVVIQ
jgi:hypothetical protein